ncbi:MAG: FecR/PupR family sigma factor regulatory protein [Proteobacteria bacterium]|nr:FecR/PupR family sigma factor regulatory protein [Pseudomonadota bacterium]
MPPSLPPSQEQQIQEEAALWFARLRGESVSGQQRAAFARWLAADPAHAREFKILEQIWDDSSRLQRQAPPARQTVQRGLALGCVILVCGWLGLHWFDGQVSTEAGEVRHVELDDGSELDIAPHSRLRISIDDKQRSIDLLAGEIAVNVAVDRQRPFAITAGGNTIRDIGTRFAVLTDTRHTRVTVAEGIVDILPAAKAQPPLRLNAGEAAVVENGKIGPVLNIERRSALNWTRGQLAFDATPLAEVITELNRFRKQPIVLDDARLGEIRVSGVFLIGDESTAPSALQQIAPIHFVASGGRLLAQRNK